MACEVVQVSTSSFERIASSLASILPAGSTPDLDVASFKPNEADELVRERVSRAEREVSLLRLAAVVVNVAVSVLLVEQVTVPESHIRLILGGSVVYAGGVAVAGWSSERTGIGVGYATAATDAILIATWIYATGGLDSPFHVLWYASIAAVAYRFDILRVGVASAGYVGLYTLVAVALGQLPAGGSQLVLHGAYIPLTGGLVALLAHTHADEARARLEIEATQSERERNRIARVEEKWRSILENAPEIVMMVDPDGGIEYCNLVDEDEQEEIQGAPATDWLPSRAHERFEDALARVVEDGETECFEIEGRRPGGGIGAYVTRLGPITKDGEVVGASLVSTDVSKLRATQIELEEHARELERSHEILAEYARLAAHDLQEPLRDISCYAQLIEEEAGDGLPDEISEYATFAIQGAKRLHRLVGAMRELSEVDARTPDVEALDLEPVVQDAITTVLADLDGGTAEIEVRDMVPVQADEVMLRQALAELIDNALNFGGEQPRIRIGAEQTEGEVALWVEDDGPGIPVDYQDRVLEAFERLHAWSEVPGAGTGLAIADRVAVKHGGRLTVEASDLGGTRMVLQLPRSDLVDVEEFASASTSTPSAKARAEG